MECLVSQPRQIYIPTLNTKKIFIVRHGQTDYNKKGMVQGSGIDAPINETGKEQASKFYEAYKETPFDRIYVSELQRTYQSVAQFIEDGIPYTKLGGLNEISWGSQEGKAFSEESSLLYHDTVKAWNSGQLDQNVGGGESPLDVKKRQKEAINHILSKTDEELVLICMHGRAMRILLAWVLGYDLRFMDHFEHQNLGLYELTYTGSFFRIDTFNDTRHLTTEKVN